MTESPSRALSGVFSTKKKLPAQPTIEANAENDAASWYSPWCSPACRPPLSFVSNLIVRSQSKAQSIAIQRALPEHCARDGWGHCSSANCAFTTVHRTLWTTTGRSASDLSAIDLCVQYSMFSRMLQFSELNSNLRTDEECNFSSWRSIRVSCVLIETRQKVMPLFKKFKSTTKEDPSIDFSIVVFLILDGERTVVWLFRNFA